MVSPVDQDHRLLPSAEEPPEAAQHGVRVPDALGVNAEQGLHLLREAGNARGGEVVVRAVFTGGVGHMILNGGGVVEDRGFRRLKELLNETGGVAVGDPAALVLRALHVSHEQGFLRAEPAVDVLPVVEPVVPRMIEGGLVAVVPEDPEETVQIPVYHPHGGGGGGGEGVGLHPRQHVELRVRRPSREAGDHHVAA